MNKNMFKGFSYFFKYAWKNQKGLIFSSIFKELLTQLNLILMMIFPKVILDSITQNKGVKSSIIYILSFIILVFIVKSLINLFNFLTESFTEKLEVKSEIFFCEKSADLDYKFIESKKFLDMREQAQKYMYSNGSFGGVYFKFLNLCGLVVNFLFIVSVISVLNVWIVLFLLALTGVVSFTSAKVNNNYFENEKQANKIGRELNMRTGIMRSPEWTKEIKVNNLEEKCLNNLNNSLINFYKKYAEGRIFALKVAPVAQICGALRELLKYLYLGIKVLNGEITIGYFTLYTTAIDKFTYSLTGFFANFLQLKSADLYYNELDKFIKLQNNKNNSNNIKIEKLNSIEFKNVSFKYPNTEKYILKNINLKIDNKEKLLIVGENGAGKSTFIKLILKLYEVDEGEILINNININDIDYESYMNALSVVFQDFKIFSYSIKNNVTLFNNDISDNEVIKVLEKSGFDASLSKFEKGIHTTLYKEFDDEGVKLSGGEAQKLSIAKALLKSGSMVILDEPTAALDPRSEYDIYMKFNSLVQDKIAIYISHRLSSSKICDKIAVFENGEIVEYGTHNYLISLNGIYNELYTKQAQYYNENINLNGVE